MKIKTKIISLPECINRREKILQATASFPFLDVSMVDAVDGRVIPEAQRSRLIHPDFPRFSKTAGMSPGELGCALSHRKCYEQIVSEQTPCTLILEDDTLIGPEFETAVVGGASFLANLSKPAVLLLSARTVCRKNPTLRMGKVGIHLAYQGVGAYAYLVNQAGAACLLERKVPFRYVADNWFAYRRSGLALYAVVPHVTSFSEDRSDSLLHLDRQQQWKLYWEARRRRFGTWTRFLDKLSFERLYLKIMRVGFGAVDMPKTWPDE